MIIIDTETGGVKPLQEALLSIGAFNTRTKKRFEARISPIPSLPVNPHAAAVNGYNPGTWGGECEALVVGDFLTFANLEYPQTIVGGCNVPFDKGFLEAAIARSGYRKPFWPRVVDVQGLALDAHDYGKIILPTKPETGHLSFSLDSIASALNLARSPGFHGALADCLLTWECIQTLRKL